MEVLKITTTDENRNTSEESMLYESVYSLARDIAKLPQNHDELEVLIADRIKRFVHQQKLSVYKRILEYAHFETKDKSKMEPHIKWLITSCLEPKVEGHTQLAEKWKYGTKYSCREFMYGISEETEISKILKGIHDEEIGAAYMAGSLSTKEFVFNPKGFAPVEGYFDREEDEEFVYTPLEQYWWAKCYVKYKTEKHSFYQESANYIKYHENRIKYEEELKETDNES